MRVLAGLQAMSELNEGQVIVRADTVEVTGVRPTSKDNRAIISSQIEVFNQHDKAVLSYGAVRMLAGRP